MKLKALLLSAMACLVFSPAQAQISIFFESDIEGTSNTEGYEDQVELISFDWKIGNFRNLIQPVDTANDGFYCGVDQMFNMYKNLDASSPAFISRVLGGGNELVAGDRNYRSRIHVVNSNNGELREVLSLILRDVNFREYSTNVEEGESRPVETIGLTYSGIGGRVFEFDESGTASIAGEFDFNCRGQF